MSSLQVGPGPHSNQQKAPTGAGAQSVAATATTAAAPQATTPAPGDDVSGTDSDSGTDSERLAVRLAKDDTRFTIRRALLDRLPQNTPLHNIFLGEYNTHMDRRSVKLMCSAEVLSAVVEIIEHGHLRAYPSDEVWDELIMYGLEMLDTTFGELQSKYKAPQEEQPWPNPLPPHTAPHLTVGDGFESQDIAVSGLLKQYFDLTPYQVAVAMCDLQRSGYISYIPSLGVWCALKAMYPDLRLDLHERLAVCGMDPTPMRQRVFWGQDVVPHVVAVTEECFSKSNRSAAWAWPQGTRHQCSEEVAVAAREMLENGFVSQTSPLAPWSSCRGTALTCACLSTRALWPTPLSPCSPPRRCRCRPASPATCSIWPTMTATWSQRARTISGTWILRSTDRNAGGVSTPHPPLPCPREEGTMVAVLWHFVSNVRLSGSNLTVTQCSRVKLYDLRSADGSVAAAMVSTLTLPYKANTVDVAAGTWLQ